MAPAEGEGPGMSLALEYYAPGNAYFPDAEAYLARQSAPEAKQEGEAKGWLRDRFKGKLVSKPQSVRANKSKGRRWVRELSQPYPPNTPSAKTFEMKTELVLIEGPKGFYVLSYTAPKNRFLKNRKVFQRALDTFELIPE